jgi:hypothetical protein
MQRIAMIVAVETRIHPRLAQPMGRGRAAGLKRPGFVAAAGPALASAELEPS